MRRGPRGTRRLITTAAGFGLAAFVSITGLTASAASHFTEPSRADCGSAHVIVAAGRELCTHGDDSDLRTAAASAEAPDTADLLVAAGTATGDGSLSRRAIPCHGDGTSGDRIAFYYGYLAGHPNRYSWARARLVTAIEQANDIVYRSARESGGWRYLRVLTDTRCRPIITPIALPAQAAHDFGRTVSAAQGAHLSATNRKYVIFVDTGYYCGLGTLSVDDRPGVMNASNTGPSWARVDTSCWSGPTTAHEIFHMLGAVQASAPHYDGTGHCTDDHDLMCYQNPGGRRLMISCGSMREEDRLDCHKDDYFNTAPRTGSYLARHWNTAESAFLYGGGPARPVPPAAVRSAAATMSTLTGAQLTWSAPLNSRVTSYVVTRNGTVVQRGMWTHFTDTDASAGASYQVQAVNEAGSGPVAAATAALPLPAAPTTVSSSGTTVTWNADTLLTAGFALYGLGADGTLTPITDVDASARTASDQTFFLFRSWTRYRVCAVNATGQRCADTP